MNMWKPKLKRCKSIECDELFMPSRPLQMVCSPFCGIKYSQQLQKKKEDKAWQETRKVIKANLMTLSDEEKLTRVVFQKWVRMRDAKDPCISCTKFANRYDGGHYFDAGVYSGLIFHPDNCHKQCSMNCNKMMHGNKANYRIGLVKKIGEERVLWLEENKDRLRNYKYTKEELIGIREKYKQKIKELRNNKKAS